jgi:tripartite-type tricarboxylate transporter receptor subunit TctC
MGKQLSSVLLLCTGLLAQPVLAAWPEDKPIELVVGFSPGGGTDIMARNLASFMEKRLGDSARIVVINKPGSGGEIAANYLQHAKPDGYTLGIVNVPGYIFLPLFRKTSYQPENIQLIARIIDDPTMLVANREAGKPITLETFIEQSKTKPFSIGHSGEGTTGHLAMLELGQQTNTKFTSIPFKGAGESKIALLGKHVDYVMLTTGEAIEIGQTDTPMTGVAVWSKNPVANGVPTLAAQGYDFQMSSERGMAAPLDLPRDIAKRLQDAVEATMKDPEFQAASKADLPVFAFLPGMEWDKQLKQLSIRMKALVTAMEKSQ